LARTAREQKNHDIALIKLEDTARRTSPEQAEYNWWRACFGLRT
jgi:exonuclease III